VRPVRYELRLSGIVSRVRAGEELELEVEPKRADVAASRVLRLRDGLEYDHSGRYVAVGPFDYSGP
jgi:hypothetical protein